MKKVLLVIVLLSASLFADSKLHIDIRGKNCYGNVVTGNIYIDGNQRIRDVVSYGAKVSPGKHKVMVLAYCGKKKIGKQVKNVKVKDGKVKNVTFKFKVKN